MALQGMPNVTPVQLQESPGPEIQKDWELRMGGFQEGFSNTLRAKGALISEPRFSTPCEMRFFPREKGKTAFVEGFSLKKAVSPFSRRKNRISQGVENRGSLISVLLALRVVELAAFSLRGNLLLQGNSYLKSTLRLLLRRRV